MKAQNILSSILLSGMVVSGSLLHTASGAEVYAGTGIGFSDKPNQWVANMVFGRSDRRLLRTSVMASFHTGQNLTPPCAAQNSKSACLTGQNGPVALSVPATSSTAWCDPEASPPKPSSNAFNVNASFDEPAYNTITVPRDTVFKGSFNWDASTKTLSDMRGTMNQVMVSADQTLSLTNLLAWSFDPINNTVTASVFKNDSTAIYSSGSFEAVPDMPYTDSTSNAYFTVNFDASDPTAVTQSNIDKLIYGDCVGKSLMGTMCMTGLVTKGSMGGYPQALTITSVATTSSGRSPGPTFECYGSAFDSKWVLVDLNGLRGAGVRSVWVTVTASRYDDGIRDETDGNGNLLPSDDDLIPAVTVFQGRQDVGVHGYWYPNQFQQSPPFWAWKLTPFHTTPSQTDTRGGWGTANGTSGNSTVSVVGQYDLQRGNQNYLTIAVGGDARDSKHAVNFELSVTVTRKNPLQ